jgi:hypothetical protein
LERLPSHTQRMWSGSHDDFWSGAKTPSNQRAGIGVPDARQLEQIVLWLRQIALKVLSRDDVNRPQDLVDLRAVLRVALPAELGRARGSLALIASRGYHRSRDLMSEMRGPCYVWRDDNRVHVWAEDEYDGWDDTRWAENQKHPQHVSFRGSRAQRGFRSSREPRWRPQCPSVGTKSPAGSSRSTACVRRPEHLPVSLRSRTVAAWKCTSRPKRPRN